jgi:Zn-dependent protease
MDGFVKAAIGFVTFIFSVIVHESAHGLAAERFGDPTARLSGRITLNPLPHIDPVGSVVIPVMAYLSNVPFIGWAKPVPVNPANFRNPLKDNAYVAAAGPASNFLLVVVGAFLWAGVHIFFKHVPSFGGEAKTIEFFNILFGNLLIINCVLGVFNLVPIPPLDGHWILFRFLPPEWSEAFSSIRPYGFFILIILLWTGILGKIILPPLDFLYGNVIGFVQFLVNTF